jgi:hypothetical protein
MGDFVFPQGAFRGPGHLKRAHEVDRIDVHEILLVQTVELLVPAELGGAGVVDKNLQTPEMVDCCIRKLAAVGILGNVCLHH